MVVLPDTFDPVRNDAEWIPKAILEQDQRFNLDQELSHIGAMFKPHPVCQRKLPGGSPARPEITLLKCIQHGPVLTYLKVSTAAISLRLLYQINCGTADFAVRGDGGGSAALCGESSNATIAGKYITHCSSPQA